MFVPRADFGRTDLVLRSSANGMAIAFFGVLAVLHLAIALPATYYGQFEARLSLAIGAVFAMVAMFCWLARSCVSLRVERRLITISFWLGREWRIRTISFDRALAVRLVMADARGSRRCRIQILCPRRRIECPVTAVPAQQALCMAMTLGVRLIRIHADASAATPRFANRLPLDNNTLAGEEGH